MKYCLTETNWGWFGFVAQSSRLVGTVLPEKRRAGVAAIIRERWAEAVEDPALMPRFQKQVARYFEGHPSRFEVDLDLTDVTAFRQRVVEVCRKVPFGRVASYQDLARAAGSPNATRAVGSTMAHNRWPLIVPCHRIVRADGGIGGFSSPQGVSEKQRLLRLEGMELARGSKRNGHFVRT